MNSQQAKSIPITALLERLGFHPHHVKQNGNDVWYKSPFRPDEKDPSFHVNVMKNAWYDFGRGRGGNLVDFIMILRNCTMSQALETLDGIFKSGKPLQVIIHNEPVEEDAFTLDEIKREFAPSLSQYIKDKRKINLNEIRGLAVQVHFSNKEGKKFFGIGMKNSSGGYEVRNPYFKGCVGKKDLTFIKGDNSAGISIFEGMFNFFSAATYYGKNTLMRNDVLVLNTAGFTKKAIEFLQSRPECQNLRLYLDNDKGGQQSADAFIQAFPDRKVEMCSAVYENHNDFNDYLIAMSKGRGGEAFR